MTPSIRQRPTQERADGSGNQKDKDYFPRIDGISFEVMRGEVSLEEILRVTMRD